MSAWCACMAGAYKACIYFVATKYKIKWENNKGWCLPTSTETTCQCNQSTREDIEPKRITELFVWRTKQEDICAISREEARTKHLLEFDPTIGSHREFNQNHFKSLL